MMGEGTSRARATRRVVVAVLASGLLAPLPAPGAAPPSGVTYLHDGPAPASAAHAAASRLHVAGAPIPAFARMYRTACSTCHVAAPKLNVLGETFRMNGYRMPLSDLLIREDDPVSLGAEPWKEVWPRAIWPGDLPGQVPFALRIQTDLYATRDASAASDLNFDFPHEVYLLAGAPIGESIGVFLEAEWAPGEGIEFVQAKAAFQDVVPTLPDGALNLWVGLLNPTLFAFTDRQTDRAGRQKFSWQEFNLASLAFEGPGGELESENALVLGEGLAAVELNGLLGSRLHWGLGVSQGLTEDAADANGRKDVYYRVRAKLGGLDYLGRYEEGGGPGMGAGGQLLDRSITLEHFGYFGREDRPDQAAGAHRALGVAVRALNGRSDLGVGFVRRAFDTPFGAGAGSVDASSFFAKWEYLVYPWLTASLKADRLAVEAPPEALPTGVTLPDADWTRVLPGVVMLVRQNVRAVVEGEIFTRHARADRAGVPRPNNLWIRLDLSF